MNYTDIFIPLSNLCVQLHSIVIINLEELISSDELGVLEGRVFWVVHAFRRKFFHGEALVLAFPPVNSDIMVVVAHDVLKKRIGHTNLIAIVEEIRV